MTDSSDHFRRVSAGLTDTIGAVPDGAWSNPSPCPGWVAIDVVEHLVDWFSGFLVGNFAIQTRPAPLVRDNPAEAWAAVRDAVQSGLDDPATAQRIEDCGPPGKMSFESAVDMLFTTDVLIHTWDLAQAAGVPANLNAEEVGRVLEGVSSMPPEMDAAMRSSGHFGPRVDVAADADDVTKLVAFFGRRAEATS